MTEAEFKKFSDENDKFAVYLVLWGLCGLPVAGVVSSHHWSWFLLFLLWIGVPITTFIVSCVRHRNDPPKPLPPEH